LAFVNLLHVKHFDLFSGLRVSNICITSTWLLGIAAFHAAPRLLPEIGSALPSLALTLLLGMLYRISARSRLAAA